MLLSLSLRLLIIQFLVLTMALPNAQRVQDSMRPLLVSGFHVR